MMKSIGFNGRNYNGACLKAVIGEDRLYGSVASVQQAVALYEEYGTPLDKEAVARQDADSLSLMQSTAANLVLPAAGQRGSEIVWHSANPAVIGQDGTVTRQEEDVAVTMTASLSFAGGPAVTKELVVTVRARTDGSWLQDSGISTVQLADAYLANAGDKEI